MAHSEKIAAAGEIPSDYDYFLKNVARMAEHSIHWTRYVSREEAREGGGKKAEERRKEKKEEDKKGETTEAKS